jgi:hypothetical protein
MNIHNKVMRLAVVAVIALGLAVWAGRSRQPQEALPLAQLAVAGLAEGVNQVDRIALVGADAKPIATLERKESGWTVLERNGYAADVAKVREFLLKLADATLLEAKTALPESYAKLGVQDVAAKDAPGVEVSIGGLAQPVKLIIGNFNGRGGEGTFVRRAGEAESWLAKGNLTVDKLTANWLRRDLLDIASNRIAAVEITTDGKTLRAFRDDPAQADFEVANLPKGRELGSPAAANGLASVLSGLRFDDVLPAAAIEPGSAKLHSIRYLGFDGLVLTAQAWESEGKDYARLGASLDEAAAIAAIEREQAAARSAFEAQKAAAEAQATAQADAAAKDPAAAAVPPAAMPEPPLAVSDPAKDREQRLAVLRKEIADLAARFEGWVFVLPNYKFANMNKTLDELLKPLDPK